VRTCGRVAFAFERRFRTAVTTVRGRGHTNRDEEVCGAVRTIWLEEGIDDNKEGLKGI